MMEVCVDSVESAVNAELGGAVRVELCANLMEGGTTPSIGMLKVMRQKVSISIYVMIRPRGGDFLYSDVEFDTMVLDICDLKQAGADGFVFESARPKACTFHRAIDMTKDILEAMETIISLGFERILTSGGDSSALEGLPMIRNMVEKAGNRIIIMPGGGINERNLERIMSGSKAKEFHGSARSSKNSQMLFKKEFIGMGAALSPPEFSVKVSDMVKVNGLITIANGSIK